MTLAMSRARRVQKPISCGNIAGVQCQHRFGDEACKCGHDGVVVDSVRFGNRSSGIEGEVQAQFVVNENGRVETGTFKVLNDANPAFVSAVRRALSGMRFHAATINGTHVSQIVQQSFMFKLDKG